MRYETRMNKSLFMPFFLLSFVACSSESASDSPTADDAGTTGDSASQTDGETSSTNDAGEGGTIVPGGGITGALDPSWTSLGNDNNTLALLPDGKVIVAGADNGFGRSKINRLNADGTIDTAFAAVGAETNNWIGAVAPTPDGKVVIGGNFNSTGMTHIGRLNTDGKRDTTFNVGGAGAAGAVTALLRQPDGKILAAGYFTQYNGESRRMVARANEDGSLDTSFAPAGGAGPLVGPYMRALALQSDGKVLVGGAGFDTFDGKDRKAIVRLNTNGTLDESFNGGDPGEEALVNAIAIQPDGKVLIGGTFRKWNGLATDANYIVRLNADGSLDTSFKSPFVPDAAIRSVTCVALQTDGKVIVGGNFDGANLPGATNLARLNADGSHDTSFTAPEKEMKAMEVRALVFQPDGKLLVGGNGAVYRLQ